jgi:hypothetical protein
MALTVTGGGTLDVDNVGLNVGNNGGVINQSRWVLVVVLLGWKESSNVGLQPLNRPTGESTLNEALHSEIGNVLFGEFCRSHGIIDTCLGIRRKMLMNFSFFAGSTVNHLECMVNNIPRWIRKDMGCGDVKVLRSLQGCNMD